MSDLGLFAIVKWIMRIGKLDTNRLSKLGKLSLLALLVFIGFAIADLTIIYFRDHFLPQSAPPKKMAKMQPSSFVDRGQFSNITTRNIFASNGVIPEALTAHGQEGEPERKENDPVPSSLPLNLIGTLVHTNPSKSIAAIEVKSKNLSGSYIVGADIEGLATLEKVERGIAYIRNNNNHLLEYIELNKGGNKLAFGVAKSTPVATTGKEVQQKSPNHFEIKKADLLKYTSDLSSVLMQARAVPNRDPSTGEINGFKLLDMQPGSIYEQLGLNRGDVIRGVNGEPLDSVQKAMEFYNTFKNSSQVQLEIERNGKKETNTYDVK